MSVSHLCVFVPLVVLAAPAGTAAQDITGSGFMDVDGIRLHYRVAGTGPPLLLLHGFTGSGAWWTPLLKGFAKDYTAIVPDLPGHGHSDGHDGPYRYREVAADLYALMDQLGIARFRAVGYSAGGIVLLHMATQQPSRIESMALLSATHAMPESVRPILREWPAFQHTPVETRNYWLSIHPGGERQIRTLLDWLRGLGEVPDNMSFTPDQLSMIEARTLLVLGDRDELVPVELAIEMYRAIPDAALWVVPSQGHSAVWPDWGGSVEAASILSTVVKEFLGTEALAGGPPG